MKKLILIISASLGFLGLFGLVGTIDRQSEELTTLKQLYNLQKEIIENNIPEQELDSVYNQCYYDYLKNYYENNY